MSLILKWEFNKALDVKSAYNSNHLKLSATVVNVIVDFPYFSLHLYKVYHKIKDGKKRT